MAEKYPSPSSELRSALRLGTLAFVVVLSILNYSFFVDVLQVLSDPAFLRGFGNLLLITVVVSMIGGGLGVALGKLFELSDWLSRSAIRFLRLGMWLPLLVFWALPIWRPGKPKYADIVVWLSTITLGLIAAGPTVLLGSCYYHLCSRVLLKLQNRRFRFQVARFVFLLALLVCLLWQLFLPSAWPWKWLTGESVAAASSAAVILIIGVVILTNLISRWSGDRDIQSRGVILSSEFQRNDSRSLAGALLMPMAGLFLWQLSGDALKGALLIEPPLEVGSAAHRLLITGTPPVHQSGPTIWSDIRLSLQEIAGGVVLAGVAAFLIVEGLLMETFFKRARGLFSLTCVAPVALTAQVIFWVGIGIWQKALTIGLFTLFPLAQALSSYRNLRLPWRFLVAVDEALPYAFIGMVFAEAYAATAGLGFVILVAAAKQNMAEAIATSLITFGLLAIISCVLRFLFKRLCFSKAEVKAIPSSTS